MIFFFLKLQKTVTIESVNQLTVLELLMSVSRQTAEQYLDSKQIRQLLQRIVVSLLENRPENVEEHIIQMLSPKSHTEEPVESWPSFNEEGKDSVVTTSSISSNTNVGRRQSQISPNLLSRHGQSQRRKGMSSRMTSNTEVTIRSVPKDPETFEKLQSIVKKVDLFSLLQDEQRETLVNAMFRKEYKGGDVIIKQGDAPDNFYIIESGRCSVYKRAGEQQNKVASLSVGQYFGELALISGSTRTATVSADDDVTCWAIDQTTYLCLLKEQHVLKRKRYTALLRNLPFLKVLQDYEVMLIADALVPVNPEKGTNVVKQGDEGNDFYIILEGECTVLKEDGDPPVQKEVGKLRSGAYFGELALIQNTPRAATIVAGDRCKLVKLDRASFQRLLGPCMEIFTDNMKLYQSTK